MIEDISGQVETSSRDTPSASDSTSAPPDSYSLHNTVARESDVKIEDHKEADASSALPSEGDCGNCQSSESGSCSMDVTESSTVERGNNESDAAVLSKTSDGIGARQPAQEVSPPTEECPALPPLPETTFEFQSHWKQLRKNRSQLVAYFKVRIIMPCTCILTPRMMYMFLMRDEKEERKKQARSNKQTRQSNTAHPRQSLVRSPITACACKTCVCLKCGCVYTFFLSLQRLSPPSYPMLLQQSLETDIFSDIISILKEDYVGYETLFHQLDGREVRIQYHLSICLPCC